MPGAGSATYVVAAAATVGVVAASNNTNGQFTPGALPQPVVDGLAIQNGQYFLLTNQSNPNQNGIWYADPAGPTPVMTVQNGLDPAAVVSVGPGGTSNAGTTWVYSASVHGAPGFVLI